MAAPHPATAALLAELGEGQVFTSKAERYAASMDNLRYSRLPAARIRPADEEAVAAVLRLANQHGVPVTVRGAGSATTGAATPSTDGWVLDFSEWTRLQVDPVARMAFAQPGVTLAALDAAAAASSLAYPPDPGSKGYATVGGSIATNAGGMRGAKYGVTRDYVLALEGFLPTGEFVRWGGAVRKFAAGYNMRDLWIGSEGSLGVITGAVLRLVPRPQAQATCLAVFSSAGAAIAAVQAMLRAGLTPSALEFLDEQTVGCTLAFWSRKDPAALAALPDCLRQWAGRPTPPAVLLIETDGDPGSAARQLDEVRKIAAAGGAGLEAASDPATVELLWKIRRSCSQAMFELGPRKLNEDVVVPLEQQVALLDTVRQLHAETGLPTPTFGHAADGNFHVHIMYDDRDADATARAAAAVGRLMERVVALGGAISGEHGIGLAKSPFFHLQHGPAEAAAMQAVKRALDPRNILNPGKLWERCDPWTFPREQVRLPWDH